MYDKKMTNKICDISCTFDELESFCTVIDKAEFDIDNSFTKYYSIEIILMAIEKYHKKQISARYLANWANAYNWTIMATLWHEPNDDDKGIAGFKEFVYWEVSDILDSLSFLDDADDFHNLNDYKNAFIVLDEIIGSLDGWHAFYVPHPECDSAEYDYDEDVVFLAVNDTTHSFFEADGMLDYSHQLVQDVLITIEDKEKKIRELKTQGFKQLKYSFFDETIS